MQLYVAEDDGQRGVEDLMYPYQRIQHLNSFISTLRRHTDVMGATRATCTNAFMKTNCTTCAPTCPPQMVIYDHIKNGDTKPTYSVLSSACAVPCPFNTRTKNEYVESMMLRFVGGTTGVVGSMFLLWIWLSQPGREGEKTLSSLFCIALLISITLVTGPAFEPFRYFCHDDAHVATQETEELPVTLCLQLVRSAQCMGLGN